MANSEGPVHCPSVCPVLSVLKTKAHFSYLKLLVHCFIPFHSVGSVHKCLHSCSVESVFWKKMRFAFHDYISIHFLFSCCQELAVEPVVSDFGFSWSFLFNKI